MDRIIKSYLDDFSKSQQISYNDVSKLFEHFVNYCVVSREYEDSFEVQDIGVGDGGDCGIDGLAIIANGKMINSLEEVEDILALNNSLHDVKFILIQSKTSASFETSEIGTFGFGVSDFFSESPQLKRNESIIEKSKIAEYIFSKFPVMKEKPTCKLFYVTTGKWVDDTNLIARVQVAVKDLENLKLFKNVEFTPVDSDEIQKYYRNTKDIIEKEINFENKVLLPEIENIAEAFLGTIPIQEYFKLIIDDNGNIRKSIFYDNVRDFQGENAVNQEINETLQSSDANKFVVLNNGVTVVSKSLSNIRNKYKLEDYQIVNGCQTSHVLYNNRDNINKNLHIPIKLISTKNEDVINKIIKATNRQTEVTDEQLIALSEFHKKLESFYETFEGGSRLYYERRSKQYLSATDIEKVRIVTIQTQLKCFASMFLDQPHTASRYYGKLVKDMSGRVFNDNHELLPYYTSAFALYRLEFFFRNRSIDSKYRKFRYQMLMMLRYQINKAEKLQPINSKKVNQYCEKINNVLTDNTKFLASVKKITAVIDLVVLDLSDTETTKKQSLNEQLKNVILEIDTVRNN